MLHKSFSYCLRSPPQLPGKPLGITKSYKNNETGYSKIRQCKETELWWQSFFLYLKFSAFVNEGITGSIEPGVTLTREF